MRIEVKRITEEPLELNEDIEASSWGLDSFDIKFVKNIHIDCKFILAGKEILIDGCVTTHRIITCSRCLNNVTQSAKANFQLSYSIASLGDYLEIDEDVREYILIDFPMKVLCRPDCKGLCPGCGVDLNIEECRCI